MKTILKLALIVLVSSVVLANTAFANPPDQTEAALGQTISVSDLMKPRGRLAIKVESEGDGKVTRVGEHWRIAGNSPLKVTFVPDGKEVWDVSGFRLIGVPMVNRDSGVTTVDGRLNNGNLTSWSHHAVGFCVAPSEEPATLGFPFPVPLDRYQGPEVFGRQWSKPNGHRAHWRQFYPEDVRSFVMHIKSSTGKVDLLIEDPLFAWPADSAMDNVLHEMPYLDEFGQVRAVDWPGKTTDIADLRKSLGEELSEARAKAKTNSRRLSKYGGWLDGPRQEATGHFRTQKLHQDRERAAD